MPNIIKFPYFSGGGGDLKTGVVKVARNYSLTVPIAARTIAVNTTANIGAAILMISIDPLTIGQIEVSYKYVINTAGGSFTPNTSGLGYLEDTTGALTQISGGPSSSQSLTRSGRIIVGTKLKRTDESASLYYPGTIGQQLGTISEVLTAKSGNPQYEYELQGQAITGLRAFSLQVQTGSATPLQIVDSSYLEINAVVCEFIPN